MKKNTYIKMTAPFRENNRAARKLELINKICTYLVFITYPVYVLYLCFTAGHMLAAAASADAPQRKHRHMIMTGKFKNHQGE